MGLRAGIGQFVPQDSVFKDTYANSYIFEMRFRVREPIFIQAGTKLINVHNKTLPIIADPELFQPIRLGAYRHRLDAIGLYSGVGLGFELPEGGTGLYPYVSANLGVVSPLVSQRLEYYMNSDTSSTLYKIQQERRWSMIADLSAGIELRVIGIGIFIQGDYIMGTPVEYKSVELNEIEVFPEGEIDISGWALYFGISVN